MPPLVTVAEMVPLASMLMFVPAENRPRSDDSGSSVSTPLLFSIAWSVGDSVVCCGRSAGSNADAASVPAVQQQPGADGDWFRAAGTKADAAEQCTWIADDGRLRACQECADADRMGHSILTDGDLIRGSDFCDRGQL